MTAGGVADWYGPVRASRVMSSRLRLRIGGLALGDPAAGVPAEVDADVRAPDRRPARQRSLAALLRSLSALAAPKRGLVIGSLVCVSVSSALKLVPPLATGFIFDTVLTGRAPPPLLAAVVGTKPPPAQLLALVAVGMGLASLLAVVTTTVGRYLNQVAVKSTEARLRRSLFRHALRLPLERIYHMRTGGVASLLRNDPQMSASLLTSLLFNPWAAIVQLGGTVIVLAFVDARMLLGPLLLVPLLYWAHRSWVDRIRPMWRSVHATRTRVDADATEALAGVRVVRTFGREATEVRRMSVGHDLAIRQEFRAWWGTVAVEAAWAFLVPAGVALLLWYGASQVMADRLTPGQLVMFLFYLALLLEPMATIARSGTEAQNGLACFDRVLDVLEAPIERPRGAGRIELDPARVRGQINPAWRRLSVSGRRSARAARCEPDHRAGADRGPGRAQRRRQVDLVRRHRPLRRAGLRPDRARRPRPARGRRPQLSAPARRGRAGRDPVRWHHRREHRLWPPRRPGGGDPARRGRRPCQRVRPAARGWPRYARGRARRRGERWATAADRDRPGDPGRSRGS